MSVASTTLLEFDNSFVRQLTGLYADSQATPAPTPTLLAFNEELAIELGADPAVLRSPQGVAVLAGNVTPEGAVPVAMAYAGHQFGSYSPRLGDGRALLLGEVVDVSGRRRDIHLKGSGRTPFARGGDGKAAIGPMLREYLIAEAMHALGIPTARALAVVATGEKIHRDGLVPGAVLTRVAASHIRVGTFEYAARLEDPTVLQRLADYSIARHYPAAAEVATPYLALLEAVADGQASLIARWMLVGFIHGVMNTDNMTISGETIDYGPCAFMDHYEPATVFSSIDRAGRYAYGNQPGIARWNLTRLAETLLPLINPDIEAAANTATEVLSAFDDRYRQYWVEGMRAKLGLIENAPDDESLFDDLLELLRTDHVDYTTSFRALATLLRGDGGSPFEDSGALNEWIRRWRARLDLEGGDPTAIATVMDSSNPIYIPRNHLVEEALEAATNGDMILFNALLEAVTHPFDEQEGRGRFSEPAPQSFSDTFQTYCGT